MTNEQEKFNRFLEEEFNLLLKREYNTVINDLKEAESKNINDIDESIKAKKTLFTNYTELVLYVDVSKESVGDYLNFDYVTLYGILGEAYFQREMYDESIKALDKAISMSPSNILLLQRKMYALKRLDLFEELEKMIFNTFKYCYTKDTLINQYFLLAYVYEKKRMYREAIYVLYMGYATFDNYDTFLKEIERIQRETNTEYDCPEYQSLVDFLRDNNILTPLDLSSYYLSFYNEMMNNNDELGALDFLKCSNSVCFNKKRSKLIKKLTKRIEKEKKNNN